MGEEPPPPPDELVRHHTGASHKRPRTNSASSAASAESLHSTRTLQNEDLEFIYENGRIYGNDSYFMPCDEAEQDRLALHHQIYLLALKGKLTTVKVTPAMHRILDLGTGPGHWAVAIAQQCPWAEVVGIDMAVWDIDTTEESAGDAEVKWEIDDLDVWGVDDVVDDLSLQLERQHLARDLSSRDPMDSPARQRAARASPSQSSITAPQTPAESAYDLYVLNPDEQPGWHFSDTYDFIHLRGMKGAFAYWEGVYDEIYKNLAPGGWIEVVDYHIELPGNDLTPSPSPSTSHPDHTNPQTDPQQQQPPAAADDEPFPFPTLATLHFALMQASVKSGRSLGTFYMHPTYLTDAGFKDVSTTYVNVPVGQWPDDEHQRRIGKLFLVDVMEMLEPNLMRLLTTYGDARRIWTRDEVADAIDKGKREILDWNRGMEEKRERGERRKWEWKTSFKWMKGRKPL
ncbi:hypothetical protein DM02DRAFT_601539 [Periconia macrospinosa]|uniref:S-adenosyl-L-methionine-dependent methyltransferase n=1 Tax=Periconia macrospinosa TaxID=97972 RepID=A0A2V1DBT3_9PLEO|nr:hypothetical protein DM02DRAFT_601539 [Periconia macrospinosa]